MEDKEELTLYTKAKQYLYYIIIGLVSIVMTVFLPMVGSEGQIATHFPTTFFGWFVWIITKLSTALLNVTIFYCFMEQAVVNIKDNEKYKEANEILSRCKTIKRKDPRGPKEWKKHEYSKKGVTIFICTAIALVGLENMILSWKLATFLTYIFTIIMGLVFGVLQMKKAEDYWTTEYNDYAHFVLERETKSEDTSLTAKGDSNYGRQETLS